MTSKKPMLSPRHPAESGGRRSARGRGVKRIEGRSREQLAPAKRYRGLGIQASVSCLIGLWMSASLCSHLGELIVNSLCLPALPKKTVGAVSDRDTGLPMALDCEAELTRSPQRPPTFCFFGQSNACHTHLTGLAHVPGGRPR